MLVYHITAIAQECAFVMASVAVLHVFWGIRKELFIALFATMRRIRVLRMLGHEDKTMLTVEIIETK